MVALNIGGYKYDAKTKLGGWAIMCEDHFTEHGLGLGIARGQILNMEGK